MEPLELKILKMSQLEPGGYKVIFSSPLFEAFVNMMAESIRRTGPENGNFVTATFTNIQGTYSITMQREGGITPAQKIAELKMQVANWKMNAYSFYGLKPPEQT